MCKIQQYFSIFPLINNQLINYQNSLVVTYCFITIKKHTVVHFNLTILCCRPQTATCTVWTFMFSSWLARYMDGKVQRHPARHPEEKREMMNVRHWNVSVAEAAEEFLTRCLWVSITASHTHLRSSSTWKETALLICFCNFLCIHSSKRLTTCKDRNSEGVVLLSFSSCNSISACPHENSSLSLFIDGTFELFFTPSYSVCDLLIIQLFPCFSCIYPSILLLY